MSLSIRTDALSFVPCLVRLLAAMLLVWPLAGQARIEFGASAHAAEATVGCMFPLAGRAAIYGRDSTPA